METLILNTSYSLTSWLLHFWHTCSRARKVSNRRLIVPRRPPWKTFPACFRSLIQRPPLTFRRLQTLPNSTHVVLKRNPTFGQRVHSSTNPVQDMCWRVVPVLIVGMGWKGMRNDVVRWICWCIGGCAGGIRNGRRYAPIVGG